MSTWNFFREIYHPKCPGDQKYRFCPKNSPSGGATVVQKGKRKMQVFENQALAFCLVPGAGIEPARIAPLVFETSASTDSAIRAGVFQRS